MREKIANGIGFIRGVLASGLLVLAAGVRGAGAEASGKVSADDSKDQTAAFDRNMAPLLNNYCSECHSGKKPKGDVTLVFPTLLFGKGGGTVDPGRHVVCPPNTPICNLWLSLMDRMGVAQERFGDSTGRLAGLTV